MRCKAAVFRQFCESFAINGHLRDNSLVRFGACKRPLPVCLLALALRGGTCKREKTNRRGPV